MLGPMSAEPVMINLGAGLQSAEGWTNYDRSRVIVVARRPWLRAAVRLAHRIGIASKNDVLDWPKATRSVDVAKGIPHADNSVDVVYTSHMLEHLRPGAMEFVLRECHRVLRSGGVLRVVVPDLRLGASKFVAGERDFFELGGDQPLADGFVAWLAMQTSSKGGRIERAVRRVLRTDEAGHMWMYDGESMSRRIAEAGFSDVAIRLFGESSSDAAAQLDSRPHDSVHVDAIK